MKITISKTTEFEAVYLKVDAGVRYWEDAEVNGVSDSENPPTIPCAEFIHADNEYRWRPIIDIDNGVITNWEKVLPHKFTIRYAMMAFIQLLIKIATSLLSMRVTFHPSCARKMKDMATTSL